MERHVPSSSEPRPRRPIFLDGGRPVKPTIWRRLRAWSQTMSKYSRLLLFAFVWGALLGFVFPSAGWLAVGIASAGLSFASLFIWDSFQAKRELAKMHQETEFLVWFDKVNAIASQYNWRFFGTPGWRQHFRNGLTPEQAFELAKSGAEKSIGRLGLGRSKITRLKGPGIG
jgi:hypothetical protein